MANEAQSGSPGGWGQTRQEKAGGSSKKTTPVYTPASSDGTYTDPQGRPISREQAMQSGSIDAPGTTAKKLAEVGADQRAAEPQRAPVIGIEEARKVELQKSIEKTSISREEAAAIQTMLKSPTAQFASQETAQRGFEAARRYNIEFMPEQVRATLVPTVTYQEETKKEAFFTASPKYMQRPTNIPKYGPQPGSIAEMNAMRRSLVTYRPAMASIALSERLQKGVESTIGYSPEAPAPIKFASGFASVFTAIPSMVGTGVLGYEALVKYPSLTLREAPRSAIKIGTQMIKEAKEKPIETVGMIAGLYVGAGGRAGIKTPELKAFAKSEEAILAPRRAETRYLSPQDIEKALKKGRVTLAESVVSIGSKGYKPTGFIESVKAPVKQTRPVEISQRPSSGIDWAKELNIGYAKTMKAEGTKPLPKSVTEPVIMERVKIQTVPQQPKLRPVMEIDKPVVIKGLERGLYTKSEIKAISRPVLQLKTIPINKMKVISKPGKLRIGSLFISKTFVRPKTQRYPTTQTQLKTISKPISVVAPTTTIITRQIQKTTTPTTTKIRVIPEVKTLVKTQPMVKIATRTKLDVMTKQKVETPRKQKLPSTIKTARITSVTRGKSRKYTTILGGKTFEQLTKRKRGFL